MESEEKLILQILNLLKSETKIPHPKNDLQKFISSCEYPILNDDQLNSFLNQYHESNDLLASLLILHEIFIFEAVYIYIAIFVAQYGIEVVHFNHFAVWCRA